MKKKKIGILTLFYHNYNYGGVLQAYALQKKIELLGYDSKQISYDIKTGYIKKSNKIKRFLRPIKKFYIFFKDYRWNLVSIKIKNKIKSFTNSIPHTEVVNVQTIKELNNYFDVFICGSDQIWNPIGYQPTLMLSFVDNDKIKIAYAASIAKEKLEENELDFICKYISDFKTISIREPNDINRIQNKTGKKVKIMPDPTLIIEPKYYEKILSARLMDEEYILAYFLGNNEEQKNEVIKYAQLQNKKIVFIPFVNRKSLEWDLKNKNKINDAIGIKEFLSLIYYSSLVITDSFHGAVFSILFNKNFLVLDRFKENDKISMNSRLDNLLKRFGLESRRKKVFNAEQFIYEQISNEEKNNINKILSEERKKADKYLKEALNYENE